MNTYDLINRQFCKGNKTTLANWVIINIILRVAYVAAAGFLSHYQNDPQPYVGRHITDYKMC